VKCELDTLKMKETELVEELNTYKDKVLTTVFLSNLIVIYLKVMTDTKYKG